MIILSEENFTDWVAIIFTNHCHILFSTSELVRSGGEGSWSYQVPGSRLYITSCCDMGWHHTRHHTVLWHVDITSDTHNSVVMGKVLSGHYCMSCSGGGNSDQYNQAGAGNWQKWGCITIKTQREENCINVNIILAPSFYFWEKMKNLLCSDPRYQFEYDQIMLIAWRKKRWEILVLNLSLSFPKHLGIN